MRLTAGVDARKLNYGNNKAKEVIVKLNESKTGLIVLNQESSAKSTSYLFKNCMGVLYGPHTTTFLNRKLAVLKNMQYLRMSHEDVRRRVLDLQ